MEQARAEANAAKALAKSRLFQLVIDTAAAAHVDVEEPPAKTVHG